MILLLLVAYGLRAREVAALTLDDIDWRRDRLAIPGRKAGHSTAFPLSAVVGEALVDYLRHGRPLSTDWHMFFRALAPAGPASRVAVSACARHYLLQAAPGCSRPGHRPRLPRPRPPHRRQHLSGLGAAAGRRHEHLPAVLVMVIAPVGVNSARALAWPAAAAAYRRIAAIKGISWVTSLRCPSVSETASGIPCPSVITWCLEPVRA